jgi:hypothetical protein
MPKIEKLSEQQTASLAATREEFPWIAGPAVLFHDVLVWR